MKLIPSTVFQFTAVALLALTSCGAPSDQSRNAAQNEVAPPAGLPAGAVIAVPTDANGRELREQADMRLIPDGNQELAGEGIYSAYNTGRRPDGVLDEMDATSSTESCHGWNNYRLFGRPGLGFGGYNRYQPIYSYGGQSYNWQYQNQYSYGNTNYYYYYRQPSYGQWPGNSYGGMPGGYGVGNNYGAGNNYGMGGNYGQIQPIGYY